MLQLLTATLQYSTTPFTRSPRARLAIPAIPRQSPARMSSIFGTLFRVSTFGESHGAAIGCIVTLPIGCAPGAAVGAAVGGGTGATVGAATTPDH